MGDYAKAIEVLQHAIALFPTPEAYSNLGIAYFNLRRFDDSVTALEHACTANTKDYDISCGNLARAYYWSPSRRNQARKMYERAIRMAERDPTRQSQRRRHSRLDGELLRDAE